MATFSTLAKCLIATVVVGGGVTGAVLGTTGSKDNKEEQVVIQSKQQEGHNNPFSSGVQSSDQSTELMDTKGDRPEEKEEKQLEQTVSLGEDISESSASSTTPKALEESAPNPATKSVSPSKDQDLEIKSTDREDPISKVVPEKEVKAPEPSKGHVTPPRKKDLKTRVPKRHTDRPSLKNKLLSESQVASQESSAPKEEDWSNKNWFAVKWSGNDVLDEFSWSINECTSKIEGERVVFNCPWNWEPEKIVELHLSLSSDDDLTEKKWEDVRELNFATAGSEISATLGLIFADNSGKEITLILERRDS